LELGGEKVGSFTTKEGGVQGRKLFDSHWVVKERRREKGGIKWGGSAFAARLRGGWRESDSGAEEVHYWCLWTGRSGLRMGRWWWVRVLEIGKMRNRVRHEKREGFIIGKKLRGRG